MRQATMGADALGCGSKPTLGGKQWIVQRAMVRSGADSSPTPFTRFGDYGASPIVRQALRAEDSGLGRWESTVSFARKSQRFPEQHGLISLRRGAELARSSLDPTPTYFRDAPVCPKHFLRRGVRSLPALWISELYDGSRTLQADPKPRTLFDL